MNWTASYGNDIYMEFPRSTCKEIIDKGKTITYVGCCGHIPWCDKKIKEKEKKVK